MSSVVSRFGRVALTLICTSCAGAPPQPGAEPAPPAPDTHEGEAAPSSAAETTSPLPDDPAAADVPAAPPSTPESGFDLDEWAYQHRIKVDIVADGCEAPGLGSSPKDYIWCGHHQEQSQTVLYTRALYTARGQKMVKLVEIPVAIALLDDDSAPRPEAERYRVKLELTRTDASHVKLKEASGFDCDQAKRANQEDKSAAPVLFKELAAGIGKVCRSRGTWTFAGGTLRRTGP